MKAWIAILATIVFATAAQAQQSVSTVLPVGINSVYVPDGFDEESDAFVVVNGIFPNGCYSWNRADVSHDGKSHDIHTFANVASGMCLMVLVPFSEEVYLGQLESGSHTLRFHNGDGTIFERQLEIE